LSRSHSTDTNTGDLTENTADWARGTQDPELEQYFPDVEGLQFVEPPLEGFLDLEWSAGFST
jgi:hypothetical protein